MKTIKCNFYVNVKHLKDGESKIFQCRCRRHHSNDISVVKYDGVIHEAQLTPDSALDDDATETEPFNHMITILMIMFGDARELEDTDKEKSDRLKKDAFEYAHSWLGEYSEMHDINTTGNFKTLDEAIKHAKRELV